MIYGASSFADLEQVIALAVQLDDPTKMAVAAMKRASINSWTGYQYTYVFVVDTTTGAHSGKAV